MNGLHVAIIMDGNGRWARSQGMPRWRGHVEGMESVRRIVRSAPDLGVDVLTLYAFSSDNWKRPRMEVGRLFWLMRRYCVTERKELVRRGVRVTAIGRRDRIPAPALQALKQLERDTAGGTRLHLRLAIDYSSRTEVARATRELAGRVRAGKLAPEQLTEELLTQAVTGGVPMPDLLIRTAGERRLSDFMLWELAYTELYFAQTQWPDFRHDDLATALADFRTRERRFGGVAEEEETELAVGA